MCVEEGVCGGGYVRRRVWRGVCGGGCVWTYHCTWRQGTEGIQRSEEEGWTWIWEDSLRKTFVVSSLCVCVCVCVCVYTGIMGHTFKHMKDTLHENTHTYYVHLTYIHGTDLMTSWPQRW